MATKTTTKKTTTDDGTLQAYNVKAKKMEPMVKSVVIDVTANGRYFAKGLNKDGDKLCTALGEAKAKAAVKAGTAKKGTGW